MSPKSRKNNVSGLLVVDFSVYTYNCIRTFSSNNHFLNYIFSKKKCALFPNNFCLFVFTIFLTEICLSLVDFLNYFLFSHIYSGVDVSLRFSNRNHRLICILINCRVLIYFRNTFPRWFEIIPHPLLIEKKRLINILLLTFIYYVCVSVCQQYNLNKMRVSVFQTGHQAALSLLIAATEQKK